MNTWGNRIKLSIFGESHGGGIGIVIDGLPPGLDIPFNFIRSEMARRAPGRANISTARTEADEVEVLSGVFEGKTTGTPVCGLIRNTNTASRDYRRNILRPGHADYTGFVKYKGFADYRGGGHFSGRITAPLVFAGAIAKSALKNLYSSDKPITIGAHLAQIGVIKDTPFDGTDITSSLLESLTQKPFPVIDDNVESRMKGAILEAKEQGSSIGGIIECAAVNLPAGMGEPFFASMESLISSMMFSIPAIKGIEFGAGFGFATEYGHNANDEIYTDSGAIRTYTNKNGGINGGITNGMPLIFRVAVKPTPSVSIKQRTVDIDSMTNCVESTEGRHDPCIAHRAVPVVESGLALCLLDMLLVKN